MVSFIRLELTLSPAASFSSLPHRGGMKTECCFLLMSVYTNRDTALRHVAEKIRAQKIRSEEIRSQLLISQHSSRGLDPETV